MRKNLKNNGMELRFILAKSLYITSLTSSIPILNRSVYHLFHHTKSKSNEHTLKTWQCSPVYPSLAYILKIRVSECFAGKRFVTWLKCN